jgi:hypothetical protein
VSWAGLKRSQWPVKDGHRYKQVSEPKVVEKEVTISMTEFMLNGVNGGHVPEHLMDVPMGNTKVLVRRRQHMEICDTCELNAATPIAHCVKCETRYVWTEGLSHTEHRRLCAIAEKFNVIKKPRR